MKTWNFTERIENVVLFQYYTVEAETEEEALALVQAGHGFVESYYDVTESGDITLDDVEDILENDPEFKVGEEALRRFDDFLAQSRSDASKKKSKKD